MKKRLCQWFENKIEEDSLMMFSNEAHFWLFGDVNSNNCVYWGAETQDEVLQMPLNSVKCMDLGAISKQGIIGLFWFENTDEEAVTVTKKRYIDELNKFWRALGTQRGVNRDV